MYKNVSCTKKHSKKGFSPRSYPSSVNQTKQLQNINLFKIENIAVNNTGTDSKDSLVPILAKEKDIITSKESNNYPNSSKRDIVESEEEMTTPGSKDTVTIENNKLTSTQIWTLHEDFFISLLLLFSPFAKIWHADSTYPRDYLKNPKFKVRIGNKIVDSRDIFLLKIALKNWALTSSHSPLHIPV